jgi:Alcohol dehydrogenase GroES-like domain
MVIGHEFVGEIVERGSNVSDFQVGDLSSEGRRMRALPQLHDRGPSSLLSVALASKKLRDERWGVPALHPLRGWR